MGDQLHSAIYEGVVRHRRLAPVGHHFHYRIFMMYLDLDEIPQLMQRSLFWSARRAAPAWFRRADYLRPDTSCLKTAVLDLVFEQTGERPGGAVRLLANLRYFGYLINPISCYYVYNIRGQLRHIVAEVTNTPWRERIAYVIPCNDSKMEPADVHCHHFDKHMHVSPFMPMDMQYHWRSSTPGERLNLNLQNWRDGLQILNASLSLQRREANATNLNRVLLTYPLMTAKVAVGIHWQALKLFLKGAKFQTHPTDTTAIKRHGAAAISTPDTSARAAGNTRKLTAKKV